MGPEPGLIGLGDSGIPGDPEQDVVMRPPPLRKLKDPLIPNSNSRSCAESFETLKEPGDLRRLPLVVPAVREREKRQSVRKPPRERAVLRTQRQPRRRGASVECGAFVEPLSVSRRLRCAACTCVTLVTCSTSPACIVARPYSMALQYCNPCHPCRPDRTPSTMSLDRTEEL